MQKHLPKEFCQKKVFLKFRKLHGKTSVLESFLIKLLNTRDSTQLLSYEVCETLKSIYFEGHL